MGFVRGRCAELRKGLLQYCCNPAWMRNAGMIPWNVSAICEIFRIFYLMGRHHMTIRRTTQRNHGSEWLDGRISPCFCERPIETASVRQEKVNASEIHAWRLNAKEVFTPRNGEKICPIADGTVKLSGGDQVLRTFPLIRDHTDRGEEERNLLGESDISSQPFQDSSLDEGEVRSDFWSISGNCIYRHHVEPRVKLYVPIEESFPNSTSIH